MLRQGIITHMNIKKDPFYNDEQLFVKKQIKDNKALDPGGVSPLFYFISSLFTLGYKKKKIDMP